MEIKLSLRPQTILWGILRLGKLEWETLFMILVGLLMTPFILGSLWSLSLTLIWHLLWLGMEAGLILFFVGTVYFGLLKLWGKTWFKKGRSCSLADVLLSLFFQCGLRIPGPVWEWLMDHLGSGAGVENDKKIAEEMEVDQPDNGGFWYDDETPPISAVEKWTSCSYPDANSNSKERTPPDGNDSDSDASLIHQIIFEQMMNNKFSLRNNE